MVLKHLSSSPEFHHSSLARPGCEPRSPAQKMGPGPNFFEALSLETYSIAIKRCQGQLLEKKELIFYHQAWNLRK